MVQRNGQTAIGYHPTAATPQTAVGYPLTAVGYPVKLRKPLFGRHCFCFSMRRIVSAKTFRIQTALSFMSPPPPTPNPTAPLRTLTAVGYPLTAVGYPLTAVGYPLTAVGYPLTAVGYPLTAVAYPREGPALVPPTHRVGVRSQGETARPPIRSHPRPGVRLRPGRGVAVLLLPHCGPARVVLDLRHALVRHGLGPTVGPNAGDDLRLGPPRVVLHLRT